MSDTKNKVKEIFREYLKENQTECGKFKNIYLWS